MHFMLKFLNSMFKDSKTFSLMIQRLMQILCLDMLKESILKNSEIYITHGKMNLISQ